MTTLLKTSAYEKLVKMMEDGYFKDGKTYSLNKIAADLEMSRTPVRDAVQRLCDENRLELLPSRGFRLHRFSQEEILQAYHFSIAIEGYCALRLAEAAQLDSGQQWLAKMRQTIEQMDDDTLPFADFLAFDNRFHKLLIASLGDTHFEELSTKRYGFYNRLELHLTDHPLPRAVILTLHKNILAAIEAGDGPTAYRYLRDHANAVYKNYLEETANEH